MSENIRKLELLSWFQRDDLIGQIRIATVYLLSTYASLVIVVFRYRDGVPACYTKFVVPFGKLRTSVVAVRLPDSGLGKAVNDRIFRASQKRTV